MAESISDHKVYTSRWVSLVGGMLAMLGGGVIYSFGVYSPVYKDKFHYSQTEVDWLSFSMTAGNYLPFAGMFYDRTSARASLLLGGFLMFVGYVNVWAILNGEYTANYGLALLATFIGGHGSGYADAAVITTCVKNFPNHRGSVVAIQKSGYGLASSVLTGFYRAFIYPHKTGYVLFVAIFCGLMPVVASLFINQVPLELSDSYEAEAPKRKNRKLDPDKEFIPQQLDRFMFYVVAIGLFQLAVSISRAVDHQTPKWLDYLVVAVLVLAIFGFFLLARGVGAWKLLGSPDDLGACSLESLQSEQEPLLTDSPHQDFTPMQTLQSLDFWLIFMAFTASAGSGLMVVNNLADIVQAQHGSQSIIDIFVSLFSIANCFGRLFFGLYSDYCVNRIDRPVFFTVILVLYTITNFLLAFSGLPMLYLLLPFVGFLYGGVWSVAPSVISEVFGLKHMGSNYGLVVPGATIGGLLFSTLLTADVYKSHTNGNGECRGNACFQLSFLVIGGCCAFVSVLSIILQRRVRHKYAKVA
ncbi:hypothetical protein CYMTET_26110 [Cymbomonas tetramitiformis]|uniref:Uncharacterized protein n=1 Tax=Cymbomonas tetramitiformis TaxID=36881 RepID=A0AAE0KY77_9CHLO|nr:hypothetical protein CYMTET_26110 [Cymbomonas tetramitiformis]